MFQILVLRWPKSVIRQKNHHVIAVIIWLHSMVKVSDPCKRINWNKFDFTEPQLKQTCIEY